MREIDSVATWGAEVDLHRCVSVSADLEACETDTMWVVRVKQRNEEESDSGWDWQLSGIRADGVTSLGGHGKEPFLVGPATATP
jgi:hypothetical protein